ncbi:MAG: cyclic nucleotide-binding domain-containing protein [Bacillota bacterium]
MLRRCDKGESIIRQGQTWRCGLLVDSGVLRMVTSSADGRVLAAVLLHPGDLFLSHSMFDDGAAPASLEAESPSTVYIWDESTLTRLVKSNQEALWQAAHPSESDAGVQVTQSTGWPSSRSPGASRGCCWTCSAGRGR